MSEDFIRIWQKHDLDEIKKRLLFVGDSQGDCGNCKEVGLDYTTVKKCPSCGAEFYYLAGRKATSASGGRFGVVKRLSQARDDLVLIDFDDYKAVTGKSEAKKFFKD